MPILKPEDKAIYFPDLDLSAGELMSVLAQAQMIAEGSEGAGRRLEKGDRLATLPLKSGLCFLPEYPIDDDGIKNVLVRATQLASIQDGWGRGDFHRHYVQSSISTDWEAARYDFDAGLRELRIVAVGARSTPLEPGVPLTVRVEYVAGFDFDAEPLPPEAIALKGALASLITAMNDNANGQIKSFDLTDFYKITYETSSSSNYLLTRAMNVFRRFRVG